MSTNGDKRSVSTDALETLGTIIGAGEARDAIHLAVEPVEAGQRLFAGQDIGLVDGVAFVASDTVKALGIVDPFVKSAVQQGDRFWLVVYPRQIKSLRHVWEHPDFPVSVDALPKSVPTKAKKSPAPARDPKQAAEQWISDYCARIGCRVDEIMEAAGEYQNRGEYWVQGGRWEGEYLDEAFWPHWEAVTGKEASDKSNFFSCSC